MKTIQLLRHAKSSWKNPNLADIDRPLNARGKAAAEAMSAYLARENLRPDLVLCSSARRTRSTLKRIRAALDAKTVLAVEREIYDAEAEDLMSRLRALDDVHASVMVIGHNPAMEELAHALSGGGDAEALARMTEKYPTGSLAVLEADIASWHDLGAATARLMRFVTPRDLE